jgi:hypothetical protein
MAVAVLTALAAVPKALAASGVATDLLPPFLESWKSFAIDLYRMDSLCRASTCTGMERGKHRS